MMTDEQEDKIIQLLVSNMAELGFQLADTLGYNEIEFIEYLIDKYSQPDEDCGWH